MSRQRIGSYLSSLSALALLGFLAACGPVPIDQAERSCLRDAEMAQKPRTEVALGVGVGNGKPRSYGAVSFEVSGDYLMGRDPANVFANCVQRRAGQPPSVPLNDQPGWRG
ncbi:hypothetical protein [Paracoccus tegillarcae]|uniref:Lipoprotein n=1 Tax=Paracoccus tegillarcae TaxID=1529068 RepID=A0A2K9F6Z9_9RHOB|nr:hypothetical protein [Paracoccus tegillarcae]AUH34961.1 hypothetical protein CUV01_17670 [Paracoccus tegillarcae]